MEEYDRLDAEFYDYYSTGLEGDVEFYVAEAHPQSGRRVVVWDTRQYDPEKQLIAQYFIFEELDDQGRVISKRYVPLELRYFYRYEMQHLLELCGYRLEALYGDFRRGPFRYGGEQIWVAGVR